MTFVRLVVAGFYYLIKSPKKTHSPIPHLLLVLMGLWAWGTTSQWSTQSNSLGNWLLYYSPTHKSENDVSNLVSWLVKVEDYELAQYFLKESGETNLDKSVLGISSDLEKILKPRQFLVQEYQRTTIELEKAPSSRDLWLYKGWVCFVLDDKLCVGETMERLRFLDPNNPQVRYFFEKIQ